MTLVFKRYTGSVRGHSLAEDKDELARTFDDVCGEGPTNSVGWRGSGLVNTCGWRASDCCGTHQRHERQPCPDRERIDSV